MKKAKTKIMSVLLALVIAVSTAPIQVLASGAENSKDNPILVPDDGLTIRNGVLYGIDKEWFEANNPDGGKLYVSISVPESVTEIAMNGLRDSYTGDKKDFGALTNYDNLGSSSLVYLDLSRATSLKIIGSQAAMGTELCGVIDMSDTQITTIEKSAFSGCDQLTGVVLPDTLETLGTKSSNTGSSFNNCSSLEYIRTEDGDETAVFELPASLTYIGRQTFKGCFADRISARVVIPPGVETIGSEAFYSNRISQIIVSRQGDGWDPQLGGYDTSAFKTGNSNLLVVFNDDDSYYDYTLGRSFTSAVKRALSYPISLRFDGTSEGDISQQKLNFQSIKYEQDEQSGFWEINENYLLPAPGSSLDSRPGYTVCWALGGEKLTEGTIVSTNQTNPRVSVDYVIQEPEIRPVADGEICEDFYNLTVTLDGSGEHTIGVDVHHPLLIDEQGNEDNYVYFEYCWWDEMDNSVNGPRSESEPDLFSSSADGVVYRDKTKNSAIPIRGTEDARTGSNYYMVEIYGYLVEDGKGPELFYKSHHNFIDFVQDSDTEATVDRCYLLQVEVIDERPFMISASAGEGGRISPSGDVSVARGEDQSFEIIPDEGYTIADVVVDNVSAGPLESYTFADVNENHSIEARFEEVIDHSLVRYTVTSKAEEGGRISPEGEIRINEGSRLEITIRADQGYEIIDVVVDGQSVGPVASYTFDKIMKDHVITAVFESVHNNPDETGVSSLLNTRDHFSYLNGYPNGAFGADEGMTRAEAAQMFYNLLADKDVQTVVSFEDVPADSWYFDAVSALSSINILLGVGEGCFEPEREITRAEFTAVAMRFAKALHGGENIFSDVERDDWFYPYVVGSVEYGWIEGYPDGTFRPHESISRAECASVVNRMLGRKADKNYIKLNNDKVKSFIDLSESHWAYYEIAEAANGHVYKKSGESEIWNKII